MLPQLKMFIRENTLTDGSLTYDVVMAESGTNGFAFPCVDENAARAFMTDVIAAIDLHTVHTVETT